MSKRASSEYLCVVFAATFRTDTPCYRIVLVTSSSTEEHPSGLSGPKPSGKFKHCELASFCEARCMWSHNPGGTH
ncbi:hypothetical protein BAUCODRAFT_37394 [Baudoinia panamericana UAMH 10762]|uniref:Uncharacterized protein n=1 Tax=Baudoinia panamericana (strain UAMH 10762) TaxID=717646 RepID=M2N4M2_BAUPA|nr:uncharacterized protein BAUCODRAFT_37394 [Baudoinia panamericana UAMH 10762]EMC93680.1 hypothetical protein BAUCODRAFT_37394 [Baudoinia panamericana UAMH 10762]